MPATVIKSQGTATQSVVTTVKERLRNMRAACRSENLELLREIARESFKMVYEAFLVTVITAALVAIVGGVIATAPSSCS